MMKYFLTLLMALFISTANAEIGITVSGGGGGGGGEPAPIDGQLQYNNGGAFGATTNVWYDDVNNRLGIVPSLSDVKREFTFNGADIRTQQCLDEDTNLNLGFESFGAGNLAHSLFRTGWDNVALGYQSLYSITEGEKNISIGSSLYDLTTAVNNIAIGHNAANALTAKGQDNNIAIGISAMKDAQCSGNVALGFETLMTNSLGFNVAIGYLAYRNATTASRGVCIGRQAGENITSGCYNVAIGYLCLNAMSTMGATVAIGYKAMEQATGTRNTGVGAYCLDSLISGTQNTAYGRDALGVLQTGSYNTAVGEDILKACTGSRNTAIGRRTGKNITSADRCVIIGYDINAPSTTEDGQLVVANLIFGRNCISGDGTITDTANCGIGENDPKSRLHVTGGFSTTVTPVTNATYQTTGLESILHVEYTATGAVTVTLDRDEVTDGRRIVIKDAGGNATAQNITIDTEGAETIDGAADLTISTDYNSVVLYSDGSNWFTID